MRKILKLYYPQSDEENAITAAFISISPLILSNKTRPMIPYSIVLVALDAVNGLHDI